MPKTSLSVCLLVVNEEETIKQALTSVKDLADEIIVVVDNMTTDKTAEIARKFTKKVAIKPHKDQFHINKQAALDMATQDWILWLDADEEVSQELAKEIKKTLENPYADGYDIPRKNYIFGKWIEHSGWYPDYQLRLFKRGHVLFPAEHIHEHPNLSGSRDKLKQHIIHHNYRSISQFLDKLNRYTSADAQYFDREFKPPYSQYLITRPFEEFIRRFFALGGYKDGLHGLALSLLQSFYEMVVVLKVWELHKYDIKAEANILRTTKEQAKRLPKIWKWWLTEQKIMEKTNIIYRSGLRALRKIGY